MHSWSGELLTHDDNYKKSKVISVSQCIHLKYGSLFSTAYCASHLFLINLTS